MTDRGAESPNPFSREGSRPSDGLGADPVPETWPTYPGAADPADPFPPPPTGSSAPPYADPGFDPQPTPPYANYGSSRPYDLAPTGAYGTNPYEVPPYQSTPNGYRPYGVVPIQHPRAVPAMVLGIVGIVLAGSCGIGGFVGIVGIVLGRQARSEIDAEPGRYAGRSQAVAGIVTGAIGTGLSALITILLILVFTVGAGLEEF
jgi:hypothetical protein